MQPALLIVIILQMAGVPKSSIVLEKIGLIRPNLAIGHALVRDIVDLWFWTSMDWGGTRFI